VNKLLHRKMCATDLMGMADKLERLQNLRWCLGDRAGTQPDRQLKNSHLSMGGKNDWRSHQSWMKTVLLGNANMNPAGSKNALRSGLLAE